MPKAAKAVTVVIDGVPYVPEEKAEPPATFKVGDFVQVVDEKVNRYMDFGKVVDLQEGSHSVGGRVRNATPK